MPAYVRLVHHEVAGFHVYTSPDIKGLHVAMETKADAQRSAIAVLDAIVARRGWTKPEVAFEDAARPLAA